MKRINRKLHHHYELTDRELYWLTCFIKKEVIPVIKEFGKALCSFAKKSNDLIVEYVKIARCISE